MASSPSLNSEKKKKKKKKNKTHWWLTNKKIVEKYTKEARYLLSKHDPSEANAALGLLESALEVSPRSETALELKARCLLFLRRYMEVADMLQDYIPSFEIGADDQDSSSTSLGSGVGGKKERIKLLKPSEGDDEGSFVCFSVSDLRKKVLDGLKRRSSGSREGQWRYSILGQACCHLGLLDDAMVLLQAARRLATAASRHDSTSLSDDTFTVLNLTQIPPNPSTPKSKGPSETEPESECASLLSHTKVLLRRRTAALAALDAGLHSEAIRHFSKILDGRRSTPHSFAASCLVNRATTYKSTGRIADAIADCNRALALDPNSLAALRVRANLMELIRALSNSLHDLDHLKLIYDSILRDRKLPAPTWKPHYDVRYSDVPGCLRTVTARILELRVRIATGEGCNVDYYALIGVRRGCTRSELERAHLLLSLKHKPDKASGFMERMEFGDEKRDLDAIRDQAKMSASILYRMLQKGYSSIMSAIMEVEAEKRQNAKEVVVIQAVSSVVSIQEKGNKVVCNLAHEKSASSVYQGVSCRDIASVGSMGFNCAISVKCEALTC